MVNMNLGKNIMKYRRETGITQEQLAEYMGVSKSSVSKWETGSTYPDICLLPELATLFNISVDKLIGYKPQLTKKKITELYRELAEAFPSEPEETYMRSEDLIKKYYSCFPFLYKMALLYLNHAVLMGEPDKVMERASELCRRIEQDSADAALIKDTVSLEVMILIMRNKPQEALDILGEDVRPLAQDAEMAGTIYRQMGDVKKSREIFQICAYQHLLFAIQDSVNMMMLNTEDAEFCDETIRRLSELIRLYNIEKLHFYTAIQFYMAAAELYAMRRDKENTIIMTEKFTNIIVSLPVPWGLADGDSYFTEIGDWLGKVDADKGTPRGSRLVKESFAAALTQNPVFQDMQEEFRFRTCVEKLEHL